MSLRRETLVISSLQEVKAQRILDIYRINTACFRSIAVNMAFLSVLPMFLCLASLVSGQSKYE